MTTAVRILVLAMVLPAVAAPSAGDGDRSPASALGLAITRLTEEARTAEREKTLPRGRSDFGRDFPHAIPVEMLVRRLARPVARDPFIDAYVRWQLTSLASTPPVVDDATFDRLVTALPALRVNPRAERRLLQELDRVRAAGVLGPRDRELVTARIERFEDEARTARALNEPALQFRRWLIDRAPATGARRLRLELERLAAHIESGWPVERLKPRVERRFEESRGDPAFTAEERRAVAVTAGRLAGRRRAYVASARIDGESLLLGIDETAIYDFDVNRWIRSMRPSD